jgi:hypothetical protein
LYKNNHSISDALSIDSLGYSLGYLGRGLDVDAKRGGDAAAIDAELAKEAQVTGLRRIDFESKPWAAAQILAQDVAAHGVKTQHSLAIAIEASNVSKGVHERFQAGDRLAGGVADMDAHQADLTQRRRAAVATREGEVKPEAANGGADDIEKISGGPANDLELATEVSGGKFWERGFSGSDLRPEAVGASSGRGEDELEDSWLVRACGREEMEVLQGLVHEQKADGRSV